ncbi:MAG: lamin tail domain-containing protein, partial [Luteibaculum sp.]
MKIIIPLIGLLFSGFMVKGANPITVFINEIHYDDVSTDNDEGFEIAGPAGTDLSNYTVTLYNGSNGSVYNTISLSGSIPNEGNGFGAVWFGLPTNGMQNGSPDGIALDLNGTLIQFLSYEGSFTGVGGAADGISSTDIGVSESNSTPEGESLQLIGSGSDYSDFTWTGPTARSLDLINSGQTFVSAGPSIPSVSFQIVDVRTVKAIYSEEMGNSALDALNYSGFPTISGISFNSAKDEVSISLSSDLPIGVQFNLTVSNVQDAEGDALAGNTYQQTLIFNPLVGGLVITEIMYNNPSSDDYEFIEIYNNAGYIIPLGGLEVSGVITYSMPQQTIAPGEFFILCKDGQYFTDAFGSPANTIVAVWTSGELSNGGNTITISNTLGQTTAEVNYDDEGLWPVAADGNGPSLEIINPNSGQDDPSNWFACQSYFGLVNGLDFYCTPGFLGNFTPEFSINGARILDEKTISLRFNKELNPSSLVDANFNASFPGNIAFVQNYGDSALIRWSENFPPGQVNNLIINNLKGLDASTQFLPFDFEITVNFTKPQLFVTEIMYNPPESGTDTYEFVEIYNGGTQSATLGGLTFTEGFEFDMPFINLAPGNFILIGEDAPALESLFPGTTFYEWDGALTNGGEDLILVNSAGERIFTVEYDDAGGWPTDADGNGSSLELIDFISNPSIGSSWQACPNLAAINNGLKYYATPGSLPFAPRAIAFFTQQQFFEYENNTLDIPLYFKNNQSPVELEIELLGQTAGASDFELLTPSQFDVAAGVKEVTISIRLKKDDLKETNETFRLLVKNGRNLRFANAQTEITIGDANQASPDLCINELMLQNSAYPDAFGNTPQWIEIHNPN